MTSRFKEIVKKYGKVAIGVHCGVSALSVSGLYVAIKNNVDVESLFEKYHLPGFSQNPDPNPDSDQSTPSDPSARNRTAELAASTGGALAVAILCNKALFPIRVPITMALTPPVARFLARRKIIKTGGV